MSESDDIVHGGVERERWFIGFKEKMTCMGEKGKYGNGYEMGNEWTGRRLWVDFGGYAGFNDVVHGLVLSFTINPGIIPLLKHEISGTVQWLRSMAEAFRRRRSFKNLVMASVDILNKFINCFNNVMLLLSTP